MVINARIAFTRNVTKSLYYYNYVVGGPAYYKSAKNKAYPAQSLSCTPALSSFYLVFFCTFLALESKEAFPHAALEADVPMRVRMVAILLLS